MAKKNPAKSLETFDAKFTNDQIPELSKATFHELACIAESVYDDIEKAQIPAVSISSRTKNNIVFDESLGVWKYGKDQMQRSAKSLDGAYMLLRTMHTVDFIKQMMATKKSSTLREMYYISEGWGLGKFHDQQDSDKLVEDLEIITRKMREDFKLRPEENGASVIGNVTIEEQTRDGKSRVINCRDDVGDSGYGIPYNVEKQKIKFKEADADFVIGVECLDGKENVVIRDSGKIKDVQIGQLVDDALARHETIKTGNSEFVDAKDGGIHALSVSSAGRLTWKKVTKLIRHSVGAPRLKMRMRYGFNVTVTPNHYVMSYENFKIVPKKVTELKSTDLVVAASSIPSNEDVASIDMYAVLEGAGIKFECNGNKISRHRSPLAFNPKIPVTGELARLLGYYTAEGSIGNSGVCISLGASEKDLAKDVKQCIRRVWGDIPIYEDKPKFSRPYTRLVFGGGLLAQFFKALGCGTDATTKQVPSAVFGFPNDIKLEYILGCLRGDGCADIHNGKKVSAAPRVRYCTSSKKLAQDLVVLLSQLGIRANLHETKPGDAGNIAGRRIVRRNTKYTLSVLGETKIIGTFSKFLSEKSDMAIPKRVRAFDTSGFPANDLKCPELRKIFKKHIPSEPRWQFYHKIGYSNSIPHSTLRAYLDFIPDGVSEKIDFVKNLIRSGVALLPIRDIQPVESKDNFIYDMEVEDNHTFVAGLGNICVHNCGGMFDRLSENRFDEKNRAILVHLKGQPARCTRRFVKRMNQEMKLPVVIFTDGDPWSYRIFASVAYGAIKTAHISEYLATPGAQFIGISPSDIINYKLPTDKLNDQDIKALKEELLDPRFKSDFWEGEINLQLQMGKKAEQQSLAKYGLDYVTDKYLPEKLAEMRILKR